jgi:hypothetical protein
VETDSKTIDVFQSELDKAILSVRGKSCIGDALHDTDIYKSLKFVYLDKNLHEDVHVSEIILPKGSNDGFYKVILSVLC